MDLHLYSKYKGTVQRTLVVEDTGVKLGSFVLIQDVKLDAHGSPCFEAATAHGPAADDASMRRGSPQVLVKHLVDALSTRITKEAAGLVPTERQVEVRGRLAEKFVAFRKMVVAELMASFGGSASWASLPQSTFHLLGSTKSHFHATFWSSLRWHLSPSAWLTVCGSGGAVRLEIDERLGAAWDAAVSTVVVGVNAAPVGRPAQVAALRDLGAALLQRWHTALTRFSAIAALGPSAGAIGTQLSDSWLDKAGLNALINSWAAAAETVDKLGAQVPGFDRTCPPWALYEPHAHHPHAIIVWPTERAKPDLQPAARRSRRDRGRTERVVRAG